MTRDEYRAALQRLGFNQTTIAPVIGIDARTSRRYAASGPPPPVARLLAYIERYGPELAKEMMEKERRVMMIAERMRDRAKFNTAVDPYRLLQDGADTIDALVAALEEARVTIVGLADQQDMSDDFYLPAMKQIDAALALARGEG